MNSKKKIAIYYRDVFGNGGVPAEIRLLANALATYYTVSLWGKAGQIPDGLSEKIQCRHWMGLREFKNQISSWFDEAEPEILILTGFFVIENAYLAYVAKKTAIKVIIYPLAQLMDEVFHGKIFTEDPDVRKLEKGMRGAGSLASRFKVMLSPYLKRIFKFTFGAMIMRRCDQIAIFSDEEHKQLEGHYVAHPKHHVHLRWGIDRISGDTERGHYFYESLGFQDRRMNFVYWGRLDWKYKGLDRLLNGVRQAVQMSGDGEVPFRLFLIGPDYGGGARKVDLFVRQHRLEDVVHLILPGGYRPGSKAPLRDADGSVYLSRWDGFPRTLRESVLLKVPVLVSKETHFAELVGHFEAGIALRDSEDAEEVGKALLRLADQSNRGSWQRGAEKLARELSWDAVARLFIQEVAASERKVA